MATEPGTPADHARFEGFALTTIFRNEGGDKIYSDENTGEYSKFGISLAFLKGIRTAATKDDITALQLNQAEALYYEHFWKKIKLYLIDNDAVAFRLFDLCVNTGQGTGVRLLQRALVALGAELKVDGQLGPTTAALVNAMPDGELLPELVNQARLRYQLIASKDPRHAGDLNGWLERLKRV